MLVVVGRAGEPPPAFSLVGLEPLDPFANRRVFRWQVGFAEGKNDEAGAVAVTAVANLLGAIGSLPIAQRGDGPAAVGLLQFQEVFLPL